MMTLQTRWMTCLALALWAVPVDGAEAPALKSPKDRASYAIGVDVARNFKRIEMDIDLPLLIKGISDVFAGEKLLMNDDELRATTTAYQAEVRRKQARTASLAGDTNKKAGEAFLAENKKKEGVVTTPSGLQYKILKPGDGKKPSDADSVQCHYRGTLLDGTEFDSSIRRGEPTTFRVAGVIAGWREAVKLMPVGSKWQLFIPAQLAYGTRGAGRTIGPNATLLFEIELLAIQTPEAAP